MTILPKKKQRKEKTESDGGSEQHHHSHHHHHHHHAQHNDHHYHHLHHGSLHVDPGGHLQNPPGDPRVNRHASSSASSSSSLGSSSLSSRPLVWPNVGESSMSSSVAPADDTDMDRHHLGSAALSSSTPFVGAGSSSPAESRNSAGYLSASSHQSSYHKKRHHRSSPHSDSEVLNYFHATSRHAPQPEPLASDHANSRVDHAEGVVGDPLGAGSVGGTGSVGRTEGVGAVVEEVVEEDDSEIELGNLSGNNSEDEYYQNNASGEAMEGEGEGEEDSEEVEKVFEKQMKEQKGFFIRKMKEDGACLFRAIADQVYGDQEMHDSIRRLCMDYMTKNRDYFSQYITEEFDEYIARKRHPHCHGNYIEMQAISEMFNRPIELYQVPRNTHQFFYRLEPINIFHGHMKTDNEPIRISYHRNVHYNSVVHPYKATIGVGLGLPALCPGSADRNLMQDATRVSERSHIEQTMFEDKIKETDWEATNEAIEEQVARESYLQWLQEQEKTARQGQKGHNRSSTATSASCSSTSLSAFKSASSGGRSPRGGGASATSGGHSPSRSDALTPPTTLASALASSLSSRVASSSSPRHSPPHRSLQSPGPSTSSTRTPPPGGRSPNTAGLGGRSPNSIGLGGRSPNTAGTGGRSPNTAGTGGRSPHTTGTGGRSPHIAGTGGRSPHNAGVRSLNSAGTAVGETTTPLDTAGSGIPLDTSSTFLGFNDWVTEESERDIMAQVLAMSQREFFEAQMSSPYRQRSASSDVNTPPPSSSRDVARASASGENILNSSFSDTKTDVNDDA